MVAGIWVLIILFAIYFFLAYLIPFLKSREPIIRKDCVHCERAGFSDEKMAKMYRDPDLTISESDFDFQCNLFRYKLNKNFNCAGCKKHKSK